MNWFKAENNDDRSGDILVSFDAKWHLAFQKGGIQYVFRKRVPTSFKPEVIWIYMGSPVKQIIGRAKVVSVKHCNKKEAGKYLEKAMLSSKEFNDYIGFDEKIRPVAKIA